MQYSNADVFCSTSKLQKSIALDIRIIQFYNPFFARLNQVNDLCNLVAEIIISALEYCID